MIIYDTVISHAYTEIEGNLLVDGTITWYDIYIKLLYGRNQYIRLSFDPSDPKNISIGKLTKK